MGLFEDVQLRLDNSSLDNLSVTILVKENPILSDLLFEGNKKIKSKKFIEELDFVKGQRIRLNTLHEIEKKIKDIYREKGYLNAQVTSKLLAPEKPSTLYEGKARGFSKRHKIFYKRK